MTTTQKYNGVLADLSTHECEIMCQIINRHGIKGLLILAAELARYHHSQSDEQFCDILCKETVALIQRLDTYSELAYGNGEAAPFTKAK